MPEIDQAKLSKINNAIHETLPIVKSVTGASPEIDIIERLSTFADKIIKLGEMYQANRAAQPVNREPPPDNIENTLQSNGYNTFAIAPQPNEKDAPLMKVLKFIIPIFEDYLAKSIKDNPEMPIGHAIAKLDILNVSEALELLKKVKV